MKISGRKYISPLLTVLILFPLLFLVTCTGPQNRPNFVFILVDDLGWKDLGVYGSTFYETPNLDKLAASGIMFTDAYASCPVCSPTRASIMTGKYPSRLNITDWIPGDNPPGRVLTGNQDKHQLPLEEVTIAEALKEAGYKTFFAGKWHLGDTGYFPEDQGFDINLGGHHMGQPPGGYYSPYKNPKLEDGPEGEYLTDRLGDESARFINENHDTPFLLYLSFYTVHTPIQASKKYIDHYQTKIGESGSGEDPGVIAEGISSTVTRQVNPDYASMVASMDENVGKVLKALRDNGIDKDTYIIFTSDNGGLTTVSGKWVAPTSVYPLRAGKGWAYEGGIRVPLIISGKGIKEGGISSVPVISTDFYPTILSLAGLPSKPEQHIDGIDLSTLILEGEQPVRKSIFWHYPHYHSSGWTPGAAIRMGDWKLVEFFETGTIELYNLAIDPGEKNNQAEINPARRDELLMELKRLQEETGAIFPSKNSPDLITAKTAR